MQGRPSDEASHSLEFEATVSGLWSVLERQGRTDKFKALTIVVVLALARALRRMINEERDVGEL